MNRTWIAVATLLAALTVALSARAQETAKTATVHLDCKGASEGSGTFEKECGLYKVTCTYNLVIKEKRKIGVQVGSVDCKMEKAPAAK
jgi:hypothetical protein